jgi:hypothetical protein
MTHYKTQEWKSNLPYEQSLYAQTIHKLKTVAPYLVDVRKSTQHEDYAGYDLVSNETRREQAQHISLRFRFDVETDWVREFTLRESELKRIEACKIDYIFYVFTMLDEKEQQQIVGSVLIDGIYLRTKVKKNTWEYYIKKWGYNKDDTKFAIISTDSISGGLLADNAKTENVIKLINYYRNIRQPIIRNRMIKIRNEMKNHK